MTDSEKINSKQEYMKDIIIRTLTSYDLDEAMT